MSLKELTKENFKEQTNHGVSLIDFWAPWCGPCQALTPVMEELEEELGARATIAKVNCDNEKELAEQFGIRSIPAIFVLKDGEKVQNFVGAQSKQVLKDAVEKALEV